MKCKLRSLTVPPPVTFAFLQLKWFFFSVDQTHFAHVCTDRTHFHFDRVYSLHIKWLLTITLHIPYATAGQTWLRDNTICGAWRPFSSDCFFFFFLSQKNYFNSSRLEQVMHNNEKWRTQSGPRVRRNFLDE